MHWLLTGNKGMLGIDLSDALVARGHDVVGVDVDKLDITDAPAVAAFLDGHDRFDVIANCAAWTNVDAAETNEADAQRINEAGPFILASWAKQTGARIVQISTDYVFDGTASTPYGENAPAAPASVYGRTKWGGEQAVRSQHPMGHLIVRTAWLYGAHGHCFPKTIRRLAAERAQQQESLSVVDDQVGQPTWTVDLARVVIDLIEADAPAGTYHATSSGQTSWCGFARAVVAAAGLDPAIITPTDSATFVTPAARPAYSVLGHDATTAAGVDEIRDWAERWAEAAPSVLGD